MTRDEQEQAARLRGELFMRRNELATVGVDLQYARCPDLVQRYDSRGGRSKCVDDNVYHYLYLSEAIGLGKPELFVEYIDWVRTLFDSLNIRIDDLQHNLEIMMEITRHDLPVESGRVIAEYIRGAIDLLERDVKQTSGFINESNPVFSLATDYLRFLLRGDRHLAGKAVMDAVENGVSVKDIYLYVFQTSQYEIGRLWQTNRLTVAQEHYCTAATQLIMAQLYPIVFTTPKSGRRLIAAGVSGERHEIGMRMVTDFLEMEGWNTYYVGGNTPADSITKLIDETGADLLCLTATMTFHLPKIRELIAMVRDAEGDRLKILLGGYPFRIAPDIWQTMGADASAQDAGEAVSVAAQLVP